jgi:3-oxoacyl-[acyl-carrier protein] reductase
MYDFAGKVAVVTGGRRGIGAAVAKRFFDEGAAGVAVIATTDDVEWAKGLDPSGSRLMLVGVDVSDATATAAAFDAIYSKFGRVDFLVNNAGITRDGMFHKMSEENWTRVIDVDLNGVFNCTKAVIEKMRGQEFGRIIMMSSVSFYGNAGQANYSAAKGALISLTKSLAKESSRKKITVNAILPAAIETDMTAGLVQMAKEGKGPGGPGPIFGKPEDVASLVSFLCSDEAWFINGATIDINGGMH